MPPKNKPDDDKPKAEVQRIAVAIKNFGNSKSFEGLRVKAGTRFAIEKPIEGLATMRIGRFTALKNAGLVRELGDADLTAAPGAAAFRRHVQYAEQGQAAALNVKEQGSVKVAKPAPKEGEQKSPRRPSTRARSRQRTQVQDPPAPAPISPGPAQNGSQTGPDTLESSSPGDRPLTSSTFKPRGNRRTGG